MQIRIKLIVIERRVNGNIHERCGTGEKPGDVLGRSIYDNSGRALLVEKTVLTQNFIKRLIEL